MLDLNCSEQSINEKQKKEWKENYVNCNRNGDKREVSRPRVLSLSRSNRRVIQASSTLVTLKSAGRFRNR